MSASPNPLSPSRNSISNWFKSLKKSDVSQDNLPESSPTPLDLNHSRNLSAATEDNNKNHMNNSSHSNGNNTHNESNILHVPIPVHHNNLRKNSNPLSMISQKASSPNNHHHSSHSLLSSSPTPSRPFLGFKSSSSHSFRPLSQFLDSSSHSSELSNNCNNTNNNINININSNSSNSSNINHNSSSNSINNNNNANFKSHRDSFIQQRQLDAIGNTLIFGCDIETSTKNASGTIYISADVTNSDNNSTDSVSDNRSNVAYGKVPLVIVSCGSYLKNNALNVEGIFRLAGSNKRIKHLQIIFSTPPDYGAKINWDGYTVHDAASLLRRYLGSLSDPLIPFAMYEDFRTPLIEKPELLKYFKEKDIKADSEKIKALKNDKKRRKIIINQRRQLLKEYAVLFSKLPPIQRRVLFYLLDMLSMFDLRSSKNRMPSKNLAAIFQPSILFHPDHDMDPEAYAINSLVIESMITYSDKILTNVQKDKAAVKKSSPKDVFDIPLNTNTTDTADADLNLKKINESDETDIVSEIENTPMKPKLTVTSSFTSSVPGSPLKNMIAQEESNNLDIISDLEVPPSPLFSSSATQNVNRSRPYSKSLSQVGHSEVVRINAGKESVIGSNNDDSLTRMGSNQSFESSLDSAKCSNETRDLKHTNKSAALIADNNLIKELGLHHPDRLHSVDTNSSNENKSDTEKLENNHNIIPQTISKNSSNDNNVIIGNESITPVTPANNMVFPESFTPLSENTSILENQIGNENNLAENNEIHKQHTPVANLPDVEPSQDETTKIEESNEIPGCCDADIEIDAKNVDSNEMIETESKNSKKTDTIDYDTESTGTDQQPSSKSAFSFQPSLLQGHISNDTVNDSATVLEIKKGSANTEISKNNFVKLAEVPITKHITDPSVLRKTATTPSSITRSENASINSEDSTDGLKVKKRSASGSSNNHNNNTTGIRTSTLLLMLNLKKEDKDDHLISASASELPNSVSSSPREKRTWLEKLRSRSNSKR